MDIPKPPQAPTELLTDLESIRELLEADLVEPPLLTDTLEPLEIPLLSEVVAPAAPRPTPAAPAPRPATAPAPQAAPAPVAAAPRPSIPAAAIGSALNARLQQKLAAHGAEQLKRVDGELRAAAQLLLQDVIDDFVPQIEAELKRRLEARLDQLLPRKP